jgi:choline dehydrogenase-like flavoprotein
VNVQLQSGGLAALAPPASYDVCIIGSGPAGTLLGTKLAAQGVRTLILESGRGLLAWLSDRRLRSLADYDYTGDTRYPLALTTSRIVGGNSNFWTGRCERLHPSDFASHPYTPPDNPWPIGYNDLDAYYDVAERLLRVRGGPRTRFAPPRKGPLPVPGSPDISLLKSLCARFDVEVEDTATATPTKTLRIFNVQREILPEFLSSGCGTLVSAVTVKRLVAGADQSIVAAEVATLDGQEATARARLFVVCCGGMESPRLLLLSASEAFPNGVGNSNDMVGRGFNEHPNVGFYMRIPHSWGTMVPTNKIARTHQFYNTFRSQGLGAIVPAFRQAWLLPNHILPFRLSNLPRNVASAFGRVAKAAFYVGASTEMKISMSNRITLSKSKRDLFGRPIGHLIFNFAEEDLALLEQARALIRGWLPRVGATAIHEAELAWSRHHQGACRMGHNPRTSVVDKDLRVHESPNLFVCGSEVFATGGGMQPSLSIAALALRLADHVVARLRA